MTSICYIALGSNLGRREENLRQALVRIAMIAGTKVSLVSELIVTAPVGGPPGQQDYYNAAARLVTELSPHGLLADLVGVERAMGRDRSCETRHGPRIIDLDILLFGDIIIDSPELKIPHPRMHERLFVLRPLAQIAPNVIHPSMGKTVIALLQACPMGSCDPA
ncbi:MAG: 2-amino-4-hydroxy-6-hydroxymethyldihydropteridine diphosphokinase [Phycisphaerae bacterium]